MSPFVRLFNRQEALKKKRRWWPQSHPVSLLASIMSEEIDPHVLKRFEICNRLGKGAYGIVWKAVDKKTKQTVALKKCFDA